jgi:hypothetical protein
MDDLPAEVFNAGPFRSVPIVIVVIACAEVEEVAGELNTVVDLDRPSRIFGRPACVGYSVAVVDLFIDPKFFRRLLYVT